MLTSDEKSIFKSQILAKHPLFQGFKNITMCDAFASQIKAIWGPDNVTFETALGGCVECLLDGLEIVDDDSCEEIIEPKPTRGRRAKKPKRTVLDAIKKSIRKIESERVESKQTSDVTKTDKNPAKKKVKNQGKARTFKRKTKKPGCV